MPDKASWYFDFISPYAYLQFKHFHKLPQALEITLLPILYAGLLAHWETKGPAEIPEKRKQTYQYCTWYAKKLGVPFRTPPAHPFNPLKLLRLAVGLGASKAIVEKIFDYTWGEGGDVHTDKGFMHLCERLNVTDVHAVISSDTVKECLRTNTEQAIRSGVYGIPTFVYNKSVFWGFDSTDMFVESLADPDLFLTPEMKRLATLPTAQERKESKLHD
jgi:2-hydroxychromene-2-carboxylate isomerase